MADEPQQIMTEDNRWMWDTAAIADDGERVSHLNKEYIYYGHLSLYRFAAQFCQGLDVLDAGCGAGYGSDYLAANAARSVLGIDLSEKAIAFCQFHFQRTNLRYQAMSLEQIHLSTRFDVIYCSNVLEHVLDVPAFLRSAHQLLRPGGLLFLAVPPIRTPLEEYLNLINPYHVNIWSPRQWAYLLGQYFASVEPYRHLENLAEPDRGPAVMQGRVNEHSFSFALADLEAMQRLPTMTAVFLARRPRPLDALPSPGEPVRMLDESYTRPEGVIPPERRRVLKPYFEPDAKSWRASFHTAETVLRTRGAGALLHDTGAWLGRRLRR